MDNDVKVAALGEAVQGAGKDYPAFIQDVHGVGGVEELELRGDRRAGGDAGGDAVQADERRSADAVCQRLIRFHRANPRTCAHRPRRSGTAPRNRRRADASDRPA